MRTVRMRTVWLLGLGAWSVILSACAVGPDYHRPSAPTSAAYKELAGWKPAVPADGMDRGAWWSIYQDPDLDRLEREVQISNQNVKEFAAQYAEALALVREVRAELFPTLSATASATRSSGNSVVVPAGGGIASQSTQSNQYNVQGSGTWSPDVWGSIRRQLESQKAAAQVSKADLANALLSAQSTLAQDYFDLRGSDSMEDLLAAQVKDYRQTVSITQSMYQYGTASRGDYLSALAQLQSTQAQLIALREARGQYEHAIAVLAGAPPGDFTIAHGALAKDVPVVPSGVPSALLERNPTIAAAERQMASENALIGVAVAAYFPSITLTGLVEFVGSSLPNLLSAADRIWSLGGSATQTIFDGGAKSAAVAVARANYDAAIASYRQTVLTTFQGVEDQLIALHTLQDESTVAAQAVDSARGAAAVAMEEYKAGTVTFTTVLTDDETYQSDQQTLVTIQQNRLVASAALIAALGGGWNQ
jgi:NodT family efflux transporter outer membrane factor (OMF) lipoprotein